MKKSMHAWMSEWVVRWMNEVIVRWKFSCSFIVLFKNTKILFCCCRNYPNTEACCSFSLSKKVFGQKISVLADSWRFFIIKGYLPFSWIDSCLVLELGVKQVEKTQASQDSQGATMFSRSKGQEKSSMLYLAPRHSDVLALHLVIQFSTLCPFKELIYL